MKGCGFLLVTLYGFSKRENSTLRPSAGDNYNGNLRNASGIVSPTVDFNFTFSPANYNYAYIPDFNRYYFIEEWTYNAGLWTASMNVDVLASWRDYIGNSTQYILRSSAASDGSIVDMLYPAKSGATFETQASFWWETNQVYYVVGIIGANGANGAVTYYCMSQVQFGAFSNFLMSDTSYLGDDFGDITIGTIKTQYNPFQYVASVTAFPFSVPGTNVNSIPIGWYSISAGATLINVQKVTATAQFQITKHPQSGSRGSYLNSAPFSRYCFYHPSFGSVPVDGNIMKNYSTARLDLTVDVRTGDAFVNINMGNWLYKQVTAHFGAPVKIGQISVDYVGYATSGLSAIGSALTGHLGEAIAGIGNAASNLIPQMQTSGTNGSQMMFTQPPFLLSEFISVTNEDNENRGRPLFAQRQINTIPGYILAADSDISLPATDQEIRTVKSYMEGGFFYE